MMFETPAVRNAFHALPTDVQVKYSRLEELFADAQQIMVIAAVTLDPINNRLEVIIRISQELNFDPGSAG